MPDVIMNGGRCGFAEYSVTSPCDPSPSILFAVSLLCVCMAKHSRDDAVK